MEREIGSRDINLRYIKMAEYHLQGRKFISAQAIS